MGRFIDPVPQYEGDDGQPLVAGKLYIYESGSATFKDLFSDINKSIPIANPVILSGSGRVPNVFYTGSARVKLTDSNEVQIYDRDPVGDTDVAFGNAWSSSIVYSLGEVVRGSDGEYYESVNDGNQGNDPVSTSGFWTRLFSIQWSSAVTYQINANVIGSDGVLYASLIADNLNNDPISSPLQWSSVVDLVIELPLALTQATALSF